MTAPRPTTARDGDGDGARTLDGAFWLVVGMAVVCAVLIVLSLVRAMATPSPAADGATAAPPATFLLASVEPAPPLALTDQDAKPFRLTDRLGHPTFVFFGYTHCTDICPETVGLLGLAMASVGPEARAVYVTVDPARDTIAWMSDYIRYLPKGFTGLTGTDRAIATAAAAWGVTYAKVDTGSAEDYEMSHTTDVFLVDAAGELRARFPYGTTDAEMAATYRLVVAHPVAVSAAASPSATPVASAQASAPAATPVASSSAAASDAPEGALDVTVVSSSIWSGPAGPVILTLASGGAALADTTVRPSVQLVASDGSPAGPPITAVAVRPPGVAAVSYVANVPIPSAGPWRLTVTAATPDGAMTGSTTITALDPGTTAALGGPAPTAHTPTLADVGGVARAVTTDPAPDLRLSQRSTTDALADGQPFVLVIDSTRFRVSPACGRAIVMARYLLDRWPSVGFIHLEPYRYDVVTDTAVLEGTLDAPTLTDPAAAWGIGGAPWGARSMPWVFIVDGGGRIRATYQGVVGSDEVDVIVALIKLGG